MIVEKTICDYCGTEKKVNEDWIGIGVSIGEDVCPLCVKNFTKCYSVKEEKERLHDFAIRYAIRLTGGQEWHEPDNQNISAKIVGTHLDNAGVKGELMIVLIHKTWCDSSSSLEVNETLIVNLATLLACASV